MSDYRKKLYANYVSTHVLPRKGRATLEEFQSRAFVYQKRFGPFLPQPKSSMMIDIGCGNGSVTWWLQQNGFANAEGIDINPEQIEEGRRLGVKNLKQADAVEYLKGRRNLYEAIFMRDFLEHFNKDEIIEMLDICRRSLKDKGRIIVQAPNAESPFFGRIRYGDFTHENAFTVSSLSQLLKSTGFNEVQFCSYKPIVLGIKSMFRYILWMMIEACYKAMLSIELGRGSRIVTQTMIAVGIKSRTPGIKKA